MLINNEIKSRHKKMYYIFSFFHRLYIEKT
jgi:hypothetical protein